MSRITVINLPATVEEAESETVLEASLVAGLPFPHGCRAGDCRACESRLVSGRLRVQTDSGECVLDGDGQVVLACRAHAVGDVTIEWLGEADEALPPVRRLSAVVEAVDRVATDVVRLRARATGRPLFFLPGQYVELEPARRLGARAYSIASTPDEQLLEFHVRELPGGKASTHIATQLRSGDTVRLKGPYGNAWLRHDERPLLAIAGGTGLAPLRSIVVSALHCNPSRRVELYHGVRDEPYLYGQEEFDRLGGEHPGLRHVPVLAEPVGPTRRRIGLVHAAVLADHDDLSPFTVYIAGPPAMVEAATRDVVAHGAQPDRVHTDPFLPYTAHEAPWRRLTAWLRGGGRKGA